MTDKDREHEILMTSLIVGDPEILAEKSRNQLKEFRMIAAREAMTKLSDEELSGLKDLLNRTHTKIRETVAKAHGYIQVQMTIQEWESFGYIVYMLFSGRLYLVDTDKTTLPGNMILHIQWMSGLEYCHSQTKEMDYAIKARELAKEKNKS